MNCPRIILTSGHLPGKVGTKFMATPGMEGGQPSISGMFAGALGLHRWRWLVLRISKEKNRVQSVRSPQRSWRFLGMNLRACKKKREKKRPGEPYPLSPSIQHFCPDSLAWLPSREGLSASPSLPAFGPKKSTWSGGGGGGGLVEGRGEKQHKNPSFVQLFGGMVLPCQQLRWCSKQTLEKKILQVGLMFEWERHCPLGCSSWTLEVKGQRPRHRNQSSDEKEPGNYTQG